jgi:methyltransferase
MIGVVLFAIALVAQRLVELRISARHAAVLRERGAVEQGRGHYPLLVLVHTLLPLGMIAEAWFLGARPGPWWPLWALLFALAQWLRYITIRALGTYWNVRVLVVPGAPLVRSGPYRWLRHPNYVAVVIELISAPMLFGAWRTSIVVTALNAVALTLRIRCEERALTGR